MGVVTTCSLIYLPTFSTAVLILERQSLTFSYTVLLMTPCSSSGWAPYRGCASGCLAGGGGGGLLSKVRKYDFYSRIVVVPYVEKMDRGDESEYIAEHQYDMIECSGKEVETEPSR